MNQKMKKVLVHKSVVYFATIGLAVSIASRANANQRAFIWDADNGMRDLKDVLENDIGLALTGWKLDQATGISADGCAIVGHGNHISGGQAWEYHLA